MRNFVATILCILSLTITMSCSSARNITIPKDMSKWETELKPYIEKLSDEDKSLLAKYLMRAKLGEAFGGGSMQEGLTIGQAIEKQKEFEAEQAKKDLEAKLLKEKVEREKAELSKKVNEVLTVAYMGKSYVAADIYSGSYQDVILVEFAFENKGTKDISGFKGKAEFSDMFGDIVKSVNLNYDKNIPAGMAINWKGQLDFNQFMDADVKFRDMEKDKVKFVFLPEMVVFTDGSKLEISTK